jgi:hypothetical protein
MELGVDLDALASMLVEAALVARDLGHKRFERLVPHATAPPRRSLSAAEGDYLRSISIGRLRRKPPRRAPATVALPVRLVARVSGELLDESLCSGSAELALKWEALAVIEGRTLSETVLIRAVAS